MAIVDEGAAAAPTSTSGFGSTLTFTTSQAILVGETLLMAVAWHDAIGAISTVDDGGVGNTFTVDRTHTNTFRTAIVRCSVTTQIPNGTTITITWGTEGGVPRAVIPWVYSGLSSTPLDQVASAGGFGTAPDSGNTATTTVANELVFGLIAGNTAGGTPGPGTGLTELAEITTDYTLAALAKIVSATGAYKIDGTLASSDTWHAAVATYKAGGATTHTGASTLTLTLGIASAGAKTTSGASTLGLSFNAASAGSRTALGASSLPIAFTVSSAGGLTVTGSSSLSIVVGFDSKGRRYLILTAESAATETLTAESPDGLTLIAETGAAETLTAESADSLTLTAESADTLTLESEH